MKLVQFTAALAMAALQVLPSTAATLEPTGETGGSASFNKSQPSVVLTPFVRVSGDPDKLGEIRWHAGRVPDGTDFVVADGRSFSVDTHGELFSQLGYRYGGGNAGSTFNIPDLRGRAIRGANGDIGTQYYTGPEANLNTLGTNNLPSHTHEFGGAIGETSAVGGGASVSVEQPSLSLQMNVVTNGDFPGGFVPGETYGAVNITANVFGDPLQNTSPANGQLVPINTNQALFSLYGTNYGGDGENTFGLPDTRGRIVTGVGNGPGLSNRSIGQKQGASEQLVTFNQLTPHAHSLDSEDSSVVGLGAALSLVQPEISMNWIIALTGLFPSDGDDFSASEAILGEVALFGGNFAPEGWALAHGQILSISLNTALFSLLGTDYGGDGETTFALPDLRGRTPIGSGVTDFGSFSRGMTFGAETITFSEAQLARHAHDITRPAVVPLPGGLVLLLGGLSVLGVARRARETG